MEILGGLAKGMVLKVPEGREVRPTSVRSRRALFDMLGDLTGERFCDLFAGSGAVGIEAASRIKRDHPEIKIILVTSMPEVSYIEKAKDAGAEGMWYKEQESLALETVIEKVLFGETVYPEATPVLTIGIASSTDFTQRELDVLRKVVYGYSDQEIGEALNMSIWTVRSHVKNLLQKTGFKNRVELAVNVRSSGLVIDE